MTKYEIVLHPDPKLKKRCLPVRQVTTEIRTITSRLLETMYDSRGIGLAAPQVGILKRIFVMDCADKDKNALVHICINPEITWVSDEKNTYEEGCLSIPDVYSEIERPSKIKLRYLNEAGETVESYFEGLEAICAQHELDHLNGILFIDYLGPIKRQLITTKMKKMKKQKARVVLTRKIGE